MTKPRALHFLICEDIREEVSAKRSIMGVFDNGIINLHTALPAALRLAFRCELLLPKAGDVEMSMRFAGPSGKVVAQLTEGRGFVESNETPTVFYFPSGMFPITEAGEHKFFITIDGAEVLAGKFTIRLEGPLPDPLAAPASGQFPHDEKASPAKPQ